MLLTTLRHIEAHDSSVIHCTRLYQVELGDIPQKNRREGIFVDIKQKILYWQTEIPQEYWYIYH